VNLKQNRFWLSSLQFAYANNEPATDILHFDELIEKLSAADIQQAAQKYLDMKNCVKIYLYPREQK